MRKLVTRVATVATTALGLLVIATPAFAADTAPYVGSTNGIIVTFIVGIVIGVALYIDVNAGGAPEDLPPPPREH